MIAIKRLLKNPFMAVMYFGIPISVYIYLDYSMNQLLQDSDRIIGMWAKEIQIIPFVFLGYLILSYEMYYRRLSGSIRDICRIHCNELVANLPEFILFVLPIGVILIVLWNFLYQYQVVNFGVNQEAFRLFVKLIFVYHGLVYLFAVLLGLSIAYIRSRLNSICVLCCVFYLFGKSFTGMLTQMLFYRPKVADCVGLFNLWTYSGNLFPDIYYYFSAEWIHWFRILFWIALILTVYFLLSAKRKWVAIFPLAVSVFCLVGYFKPSGAVMHYDVVTSCDSWRYDQVYYQMNDYSEFLSEENNCDFSVEQYNMELTINDVLSAHVACTLSKTDLESYRFTLYHGYRVLDVTDQNGNKLEFAQDGDYILVYNPARQISEICFSYEGYNEFFYSTTQGIYLPADFEYYPVAGWKAVYKVESLDFTYNDLLDQDVDFDVTLKVKGRYEVATNFVSEQREEKEGYHIWKYRGTSDGLTILGSPFLEITQVDGVRVVYSNLSREAGDGNEQNYHEAFQIMKEYGIDPVGKTYFSIETGQYDNYLFGKDAFLGAPNGFEFYLGYSEGMERQIKE